MIPRTYPSTFAPNGQQQMVVYFLTSVVGLQRWVDYIPVHLSDGGVENSYNNNGYINVAIVPSLGGTVQAWKDYIPVYQDAAATDAWQVSSVGYIPYNYSGFGDASLILDFTNGGALDSRVTFTRTTSGTYFNSSGILSNSPANFLTYSEQFNNVIWVKSRASITVNAVNSPDGTLTGDKLVEDTTASNTHFISQTVTNANAAYTYSVYVKAAERNVAFVGMTDGVTALVGAFVDLSTGALTNSTGGSWTSFSSTSTSVGNGWWRVSVTATRGAGTTTGCNIYPCLSAGSVAYTGDGTSGIYVWGAQLETGSTATNYIPTTTAINYAPRFDYNPTTLAPLGLLIEESRTNSLKYSQDFSNAAWTKFNTSLTSNAIVAPSGILEASLLTDNSTPAVEHFLEQSITTFTNQAYTQSIYVKAATASSFQLVVVAIGSSNTVSNIQFNQSAGVYVPAFQTSGLITSASATAVGNGWYRCSVVYTLNGTVTYHALRVYPFNLGSYAGTGIGHYFWGAQLEAGAFSTSYIPTTAAAATRAADNAVITGTNFSSWYNATEGTLCTSVVTATTTTVGAALSINDNTSSNAIQIYYFGSAQYQVVTGGVSQATLSASSTGTFKAAGTYKVNDFAASFNGAAATTDTSGTIPTVSQLRIGALGGGSSHLNGTIKYIAYYPLRLSNAELQRLTS